MRVTTVYTNIADICPVLLRISNNLSIVVVADIAVVVVDTVAVAAVGYNLVGLVADDIWIVVVFVADIVVAVDKPVLLVLYL